MLLKLYFSQYTSKQEFSLEQKQHVQLEELGYNDLN